MGQQVDVDTVTRAVRDMFKDKADFLPTPDVIIEEKHLLGRPVGGKDDLLAFLIEGVEGVEHFFLGFFPLLM